MSKLEESYVKAASENSPKCGSAQCVKRDGFIVEIKGKITPEHKINKKAYSLCLDCLASEVGRELKMHYFPSECIYLELLRGRKHGVAFVRYSRITYPVSEYVLWRI
ncbi:hypothetical protein JTB14_019586 [Gonioctena quinquepunctata]|nr:hypothetical protein JTB14_019586 [Gonioctena quinquepunctata]